MKHIESILSFILSLAGVIFQREGKRRKPPCCPCPFVEDRGTDLEIRASEASGSEGCTGGPCKPPEKKD